MCGILGYIGKRNFSSVDFRRALDIIANRGPDDQGIYEEPEVILGHRRLSILDLSLTGHQPMFSEDRRYVIVYNGEVYNFLDLRKKLEKEGVIFKSNSDTEVILALYVKEGPNCLQKFRGMFAIVIYDTIDKNLFLARDRMGIKPLYFWRSFGGLAFASEIKALQALPGSPTEIGLEAVIQYLAWGSVPEPLTVIKGIECLPPACWAKWEKGDFSQHIYWDFPKDASVFKNRDEAIEEIRHVLKEAVKLRCISDVPLGAFLSGGVDSSSIVSLMREVGQKDVRTFSISFPETDLDEGRFALKVAEQFDTIHTDIPITEHMVRDELDSFFGSMDQPTCDGVNTFMISKFAKEGGLTVSLSGLGGDELFAGYPSYRRAVRLEPWLSILPRLFVESATKGVQFLKSPYNKLEALTLPGSPIEKIYFVIRGIFMPSQIKQLLNHEILRDIQPEFENILSHHSEFFSHPSYDSLHAIMMLELRCYMHNQLLRDSDVFGMAHALEIRVPFIDHLMVETLFKTDSRFILNGNPKKLLLDALPTQLPLLCTNRPKMGFTFPFDKWLKGPWKDMFLETFLSLNGCSKQEHLIMNPRRLRLFWNMYLNGHIHWSRLWSLYVLARYLAAK